MEIQTVRYKRLLGWLGAKVLGYPDAQNARRPLQTRIGAESSSGHEAQTEQKYSIRTA